VAAGMESGEAAAIDHGSKVLRRQAQAMSRGVAGANISNGCDAVSLCRPDCCPGLVDDYNLVLAEPACRGGLRTYNRAHVEIEGVDAIYSGAASFWRARELSTSACQGFA